jgi:hypothetical protein
MMMGFIAAVKLRCRCAMVRARRFDWLPTANTATPGQNRSSRMVRVALGRDRDPIAF